MKISKFAKTALAAITLASAGFATQAAEINLGPVSVGSPLAFNSLTNGVGASIVDFYKFFLPANSGSGYTVNTFDFAIPGVGSFNSFLNNVSLYKNPDNFVNFGGDDQLIQSIGSGETISTAVAGSTSGWYYLKVTSTNTGTLGGLYSGSIQVSPIPEPETYAMLLAGLGLMGAIARRRNKA